MADLSREDLLTGAYIAGLPESEGLTPDEVADGLLDVRSKKEAEKRRKIQERSANFQARRAERAGNQQKADDFLTEDNQRNQNILGIKTVPNTVVEFGDQGTQDALQNFGGSTTSGQTANYGQAQTEIEKASEKRDPNELIRKYRVKGDPYGFEEEKIYVEDGMKVPERFVRAANQRDFALNSEGTNAPPRSGQNVLSILQAKIDSGTLAGPELAQAKEVQRRLQLDVNPQARAQSDRLTGLDIVDNDRAIYQSQRIKDIIQTLEQGPLSLTDPRTQARGVVQPGQKESLPYFTNNNLGSIGHIASIGNAKRGTEFNVGQEITRRNATRMVQHLPAPGFSGPEGPTIGYADRRGLLIPVTPDSEPNSQVNKTRSWIMDTVDPQLQEEQLKQVDIGKALASLNEGLSKLKIGNRPVDPQYSNVRSVDELSDFFNYYMKAKADANEPLSYRTGQTVTNVTNPTVSDLLTIGNTREYAQQDLARALYQLELARLSSVNELQNESFQAGSGISVGSKDTRGLVAYPASIYDPGGRLHGAERKGTYLSSNEAGPIAIENRVNNTSQGDIEVMDPGARIATLQQNRQRADNYELIKKKELDPRIKETRRDVAPLYKLLRGDRAPEPLTVDELNDAQSSSMGAVSNEKVPRALFARSPLVGPGPTRLMSEDQIYSRLGEVNGRISNAIIQRYEQSQGTNPDGFGVRVERQRNMDPGPTFNPGPDPWDQPIGTGNGITQEIQSRREGTSQKVLPYGLSTSATSQGPTRPLTNELRNELAALSSGYSDQGPRPSANFSDPGIRPDGPSFRPPNSKQVRAEADYRKLRRYGRNAAIAGGAAAGLSGLSSLISGERDNREQEQYQ